ncbi:MAG TPA: methyltransferase domain-containing protein, partial [Lysobacter sp.]|nr:methyltransferase domain-containing protein [Lysobacter sp.]
MPAPVRPRQPGAALDWFGGEAGQGLLAAEDGVRARLLAAAPAMPWLWVGVDGAPPPTAEGPARGVVLRRAGAGFGGQLRCGVPLPFGRESFGLVLVQHALDDGMPAYELLTECERVLAPGGTLWLAALNPWSAYRLHWARSGLRARGAAR